MNRVINRRQAICGTAWIIILCVVIALWPLRLVKETISSDGSRTFHKTVMQSEEITSGYVVQQMFIAQYDRLKNIDIYLHEGTVGEAFNFVLYDASMQVIMQQVIETGDMKQIPGYCTVQVNIDTQVGREYYYLLQGIDAPFRVAYINTEDSGSIYNGTLYYGNVEDTERCMIAAYDYEVPLRKGRTLVCDAFLVLFGVLITFLTDKYYKKKPERNTHLTVGQTVKAVCNQLINAACAAAGFAIWPGRMFSGNAVCILFYEGSVLVLAALLLYAVNHDRTGCATDRTLFDVVRNNLRNLLQAALFAGMIWACCNYMNGLYEIHHSVAYRQMLIFFALAVLVTYRWKDLFNVVNFIYIIAAVVAGYRYYGAAVAALENPEELDIPVIRLTVWAGILAGLVIIGTIRFLIRRQVRDLSVPYVLLVTAFFVLIILYRNTRGWPVYLVCAFSLFYLNMAAWDKKEALLRNICNGILLHFGAMVIYCLLHRPYMFFQYYRYPFIFHTVTMSAVYLALVVCAALVKFLDAYRREQKLAVVYKELILFGVSAVYLLLTLSRTGYLAIMVMAAVMIPVMCFSMKKRWRSMGRSIGMMLLAVVLCFPVTFTAQRAVPAVVARPLMHEIEELPVEIAHGRYTDSRYYMTIQRFIQVFQMKILGIPEEKSLRAIYMVSDAGDANLQATDAVSGGDVDSQGTDMAGSAEGGHFRNDLIRLEDEILLASVRDISVAAKEGDMLFAAEQDSGTAQTVSDAESGSADSAPEQMPEDEEEYSYTNGRMEIFSLYYRNLNKVGHEDMGIMEPDGNYVVHAHNIYLQTAYDHGIYVGLAFILLGAGTLVQAAVYYHKRKGDRVCAALPLALLILFAVAGLTEWIFHPCSPIACCLLLTLAPLLVDKKRAV